MMQGRRRVLADTPRPRAATWLRPVSRHFQVLSNRPTRIRIHIPDWGSFVASALEHRLQVVTGVCAVRVSPPTQNVLIHFDSVRGVRNRVLRLIHAVLTRCGETTETAAHPVRGVTELEFPALPMAPSWKGL